ncbi:O-antigen ligase family protein [Bacillus sp. 7894-2]|uniref:O-antigen ligase family protein n=1 Tax=Bacillus sp. 7894-2 TaxID=2021695 RepID=UPI000BA6138F|nr:O-antigen ligase family protein [Bacillus sp. 7894-2]PAE25816.1 hypothetical protein CHI10_05915 [Bacillus sp. 7894-2]
MLIPDTVFKKINLLMLLFILFQPFLDLFTSLSIRLLGYDLTIGLIVRMLFLAAAGMYLILLKNNPFQKTHLLYFGLLGVLLLLNLYTNYATKPIFLLAEEIKYLVKLVYFNVILILYYVIFKTLSREIWMEKTLRYLFYSVAVIGGVMTAAGLTGTAFASYEGGKEGHVGWFYAGNELGAILAMLFPVAVLLAIRVSKWYWIPVVFSIYSLLALGTKVGYGAIMIVLLFGLIFSVYDYVKGKKAGEIKIKLSSIWILLLLMIGTALYTPFSPLATNMNMHLSWLGMGEAPPDTEMEEEYSHTAEVTDEQMQNLVYSGREKYWSEHREYFKEAPLTQKLFGMGYAGNYQSEAKMIEMDFHDVFYSLGYLGSLVYLAPLIFMLYMLAKVLIKRFSFYLEYENALLASGIALGLGIALIAGHVLTAPGVSIYLGMLTAFLVLKAE